MKIQRVKIVTFSSLFILLCLQVVWSVYTYKEQHLKLEKTCNAVFYASTFKDLMQRSKESIPEGTEIVAGTVRDDGKDDYVSFQEALIQHNSPINLSQLDSFYQEDLLAEDISVETIINRINPKTREVLESTDSTFHGSWGAITTYPEYLRRDSTEAVVAVVVSPVQDVLRRVWLLYLSSIVLIGFAAWGLYYQVKIIFDQNRLSELRETFSRTMVHDMKTPISSIITGIRMLRGGQFDSLPEKKQEIFDLVERENQHLLSLVNKVLTIAKMESGKLVLNRKQIALKPMVDELMEKYPLRSKKAVTFSVDVPDDAVVYADPSHLTECLSNLVENAEKYSGQTVHIVIAYAHDEAQASIRVSDNGVGIPQSEQARIFEKFERASRANKRSTTGTGATGFGLGLNYVQLMMKEHGGSVTVSSEPGRGSTFTLTFPVPSET
jgi:two-component system sensor histidine kinase